MPDYESIILRSVATLPYNNASLREAVYTRARAALTRELTALEPPLPRREVDAQEQQLEIAIYNVEREYASAPDAKADTLQQSSIDRLRSTLSAAASFEVPNQDQTLQFDNDEHKYRLKVSRQGDRAQEAALRQILQRLTQNLEEVFRAASNQHNDTYVACKAYRREINRSDLKINPIAIWAAGLHLLSLLQRNEAERREPSGKIDVYDSRQEFALRELISVHGPYILCFDECRLINEKSRDFSDPFPNRKDVSGHFDEIWKSVRSKALLDHHSSETVSSVAHVN